MIAGKPSTLEIEIKLDLGSFANYLKLLGHIGHLDAEKDQRNAFFDTEDQQLRKLGWALRVRSEDKGGLVTLKSTSTQTGAAAIRDEIEEQIPLPMARSILELQTDLMTLSNRPVDYARDLINDSGLTRLVEFRNLRKNKIIRLGEYDYQLEIDKTQYNNGSVDYELELELTNRDQIENVSDALQKLLESLDIPFEKQTESKFARALEHEKVF